MILIDASVWIEHVRARDEIMLSLIQDRLVLTHPFVIGELALGHVRRRDMVLAELQELPLAKIATDGEVLRFVASNRLFGLGIGYIDAHLLASCMLTKSSSIWTLDKRLRAAALKFGLAADRP
jgi:predicted nucleic acid-binding protein